MEGERQLKDGKKLEYVVCLAGEGKKEEMSWDYEVKRSDWVLGMREKRKD